MRNKYRIENGLVYIIIRRLDEPHIETVVDLNDLPRLLELDVRWSVSDGYVRCTKIVNGKTAHLAYLHRFIMDTPEHLLCDHRNHNTLDNRKKNLRNITVAENNLNKSGAYSNNKTTGIRGISYRAATGKWQVYATKNKKQHFGGRFDNLEDAKKALEKLRKSIE